MKCRHCEREISPKRTYCNLLCARRAKRKRYKANRARRDAATRVPGPRR